MLHALRFFFLILFIFSYFETFVALKSGQVTVDATGNSMAAQTLTQQQLVAEIQKVLSLHKQGLTNEAIKGYERVIPLLANSPTKISLLGNVGALYMNQGNWEQAREHFNTAVELAPDNSQAQFNLAVLLTSKLNQHAKALKHCALAMRIDKNNHKYYHLMGNILQNLGKTEEAERYFNLAESLAEGKGDETNHLSSQGNNGQKSSTEGSVAQQSSGQSEVKQSSPLEISRIISKLKSSFDSTETVEISVDDHHYKLKLLSKTPFAFIIDHFLSESECEYIRDKAVVTLEKSFVMGNSVKPLYTQPARDIDQALQSSVEHTEEDPSLYRSSYNTWLPQDSVLSKVQERLSIVLGIPLGYIKQKSEDLQVVKYNIGGQFKPHQDSSAFHPRLLTALMYLNDLAQQDANGNAKGGETWFPFANDQSISSTMSTEEAVLRSLNIYEDSVTDHQEDSLPGVRVSPLHGSILVFFNYQENGKIDPLAVHSGLPIKRTDNTVDKSITKWIANYWLDYDESVLRQFSS